MLPIKIDEPVKHFPVITVAIIALCIFVHVNQDMLFLHPGIVPIDIVHSLIHLDSNLPTQIIALITAFFMHGGILHLAGNIWYLWIFGNALENCLPTLHFLSLYLAFGIIAMTTQIAFNPLSPIPIVGASGAIAGIMGMTIILKPFLRIVFWIPPFFFFRIPSFIFLLFWFWLQWKNSSLQANGENLVAWWAHIGGFIGGILAALYFRLFSKNKLLCSPAKKRR